MAEPFAITTETFENEVLKSDVPVRGFLGLLVRLHQVAPVMDEIWPGDGAVKQVDVDASPSSPARHLEHPDHRPVRARW